MRNVLGRIIFNKREVILILGKHTHILDPSIMSDKKPVNRIIQEIRNHIRELNVRVLGLKIEGDIRQSKEMASILWLEDDIEPFINSAEIMRAAFEDQQLMLKNPYSREVIIKEELVTLKNYQKSDPENFRALEKFARKFQNKKIVFVSSTPQGGGVALMRHALIRLYRLMGVDAHWHVFMSNGKIFEFTKNIHNTLQNQIGYFDPDIFNEAAVDRYREWSKDNYYILRNSIRNSSVIVIDDPQPSGIIDLIKSEMPDVPIIFRWHIQLINELIETKNSPQNKIYNFVAKNARKADLFIFHPIEGFIPRHIEKHKIITMGAATDKLDGLNKPLNDEQSNWWLKKLNAYIASVDKKSPLHKLNRPFIAQIARFDPSKGIPDVLESYKKFRHKIDKIRNIKAPALVLCGHGAVDDPDGTRIFKETKSLINKKYRAYKEDIVLARLPHRIKVDKQYWVGTDQIMNAVITRAKLLLQLSYREGFEVKVTESLLHGKPVIAYRAGGIPLQIEDGKTGYLVEVSDTEKVSEKIFDLFTDEKLYKKMSKNAIKFCPNNFTVANALSWIKAFNLLV